jgi:hypothetical protein
MCLDFFGINIIMTKSKFDVNLFLRFFSWNLDLKNIFHLLHCSWQWPWAIQWVSTIHKNDGKGANCRPSWTKFLCKDYNPRRFHGVMANNNHDEFEKNDCYTNNVLLNKGAMNIPFGSIFLWSSNMLPKCLVVPKKILLNFRLHPKLLIISWVGNLHSKS